MNSEWKTYKIQVTQTVESYIIGMGVDIRTTVDA